MKSDYSFLEPPIPWYRKCISCIHPYFWTIPPSCVTPSRIDFVSKKLSAAKKNLRLFFVLFFFYFISQIIHGSMDHGEWASMVAFFFYLSTTIQSINGSLITLQFQRNHFAFSRIYHETEEEYEQWKIQFKNEEMRRGALIFKIAAAIILLFYYFAQ